MASRPLRPCSQPGCLSLTTGGRCATHRQQAEERRGSRHERGYTNRWAKVAEWFKREYPLCGMRPGGRPPVMSQCHDEGRVTAAYQVDHVVPHKGNQALFWDRDGNWQSLCRECGARKSQAGL